MKTLWVTLLRAPPIPTQVCNFVSESREVKHRFMSGLWSPSPDIGRGTHEHIVEQEQASLLGFDDFPTLVVDRFHHVV